ncbi:NAD(P)/FAD-dependent oxidoreductase [Saccharopolyspora rhizosphaerae]|uniref:Ferredoxin--NADP reductase n=1 Tax=Saccharopolyspora rhizosphaerae TaxID=2492662 RepID=A0A426JQV1_9PSEU|nr:NAD(P)/FAD-dependent oxidoreductase [Saccharopolyspora rhizosphaerae]RRO15529.1 NAD(P)/FAD-dependent oxidoreductase [Saccharopolyspora rhizosphaerae]
MAEMEHELDLLVVGAGPTGLFAAYYAGFRGMSVALVDALPEPGGQVTAMYPEKMIFDVAGFPAVRGRDLVASLVEQAEQYGPLFLLGRPAVSLSDVDDGLLVDVGEGDRVRARAVLITAGIGEFSPRPLPAGDEWAGRGLVHFIPELSAHDGHDVVVVGGGDSAFDWALALHPVARSVTLVHRRTRFRAHAGLVSKVEELGVPLVVPAEVSEIRGDERGLSEVEIDVEGDRRVLPAQTVVAALGFTADLGPIEGWGLALEKRSILVDTTMRTNRPRVYAAGDVAAYPGKVKLIATGFGEAATAVNNIAVELNPDAHLFPGHSTNLT